VRFKFQHGIPEQADRLWFPGESFGFFNPAEATMSVFLETPEPIVNFNDHRVELTSLMDDLGIDLMNGGDYGAGMDPRGDRDLGPSPVSLNRRALLLFLRMSRPPAPGAQSVMCRGVLKVPADALIVAEYKNVALEVGTVLAAGAIQLKVSRLETMNGGAIRLYLRADRRVTPIRKIEFFDSEDKPIKGGLITNNSPRDPDDQNSWLLPFNFSSLPEMVTVRISYVDKPVFKSVPFQFTTTIAP
jgi:hypothetical protein